MKKSIILSLLCLLFVSAAARNLKKSYYVTPEDFGCVAGDERKAVLNTQKLQEMVDYAILNGKKIIGKASSKFYIAGSIEINGPVTIEFNKASLIATDSSDMIVIKGKHREYSGVISGIHLDLNNIARSGFNGACAIKIRITDCNITGIPENGVGITIEKGYEVFVDNVHFEGGAYKATGLRSNTADCHYSDLVMIDCHTAVDNRGINYYERIHAWMGEKGKWIDGSTFFRVRGIGPIFLNQCFCDTYDIGIKVECKTNLFISQLRNFQNKEMWQRRTEEIHPVFIYFTKDSFADQSFIAIDNSYIGGLFVDNNNKQLFSNVAKHGVKFENTRIE